MNQPVITVQRLVCRSAERITLDIDEWQVLAGERVALVGPNGAGKSTLLRALGGFVLPLRGEVSVLGRNPRAGRSELRALRAQVGQVLQGLHLVQRLTAIENVLIGGLGRSGGWRGWVRRYAAPQLREAEAALRDVGLLAKADERADRLSGGERQKVAIARMLMQRPRLILADEPTASLDPLAAAEICGLLARAALGATLITVVHNPTLLPVVADRVVGLKQGRIEFDLELDALDDRRLAQLYRPEDSSTRPLWLELAANQKTPS